MPHPNAPGPAGRFTWKGYNWNTPTFSGGAGTGSNGNNGQINASGNLELKIVNNVGVDTEATLRGWGYGWYAYSTPTPQNNLDPQVTQGGVFTYDSPLSSNNEIDFGEISGWGQSNINCDHTYWHPGPTPIGVDNPRVPVGAGFKCIGRWSKYYIEWWFFAYDGTTLIDYSITARHGEPFSYNRQNGGSYSGSQTIIPTPANETVVINLWVHRGGSSPNTTIEYDDFLFHPLTSTQADSAAGQNAIDWPTLVSIEGGGGGGGDTTDPTVDITSPSNGATVSGTTNIVASANDDVGIHRVEFLIDGSLAHTETAAPYNFNWDTTLRSDGSHTITARAYDTSDNSATDSITVTVANNVVSGRLGLPTRILGGYLEHYEGPPPYPSEVPEANFFLFAFATVPASDRKVILGETWGTNWDLNLLKTEIADAQAAGKPCVISIGGSGHWYAPYNDTHVAQMVSDLKNLCDTYGFSGIDWDYEEDTTGLDTTGAVYMAKVSEQLWKHYHDQGKPFIISCAPYFLDETKSVRQAYYVMIDELVNSQYGNILGYVAPQMYNGINTTISHIRTYLDQHKARIPELRNDQLVCGFLRNHDVDGTSHPIGNMESDYDQAETEYPGLRGCWTWGVGQKERDSGDDYIFFRRMVDNVNPTNDAPTSVGGGGGGGGDTTPPNVSLSSPTAGATLSGTVTVSATASDDVGVARVEFYVDGVLRNTDTSSPYSWSWNTADYNDGTHTVYARAVDTSGNTTQSTSRSVTTDNDVGSGGGTQPVEVFGNTNSVSGSQSLSIPIPAEAEVGDTLMVIVTHGGDGATPTASAPGGALTARKKVGSIYPGHVGISVLSRAVQNSDLNGAVSVQQSSWTFGAAALVVSGVTGNPVISAGVFSTDDQGLQSLQAPNLTSVPKGAAVLRVWAAREDNVPAWVWNVTGATKKFQFARGYSQMAIASDTQEADGTTATATGTVSDGGYKPFQGALTMYFQAEAVPTNPPGQITDWSVAPGDSEFTVTWNPPSTGGTPTDYRTRYRSTGSSTWIMHTGRTSPTTIGASNGTTYDVQVAATNDDTTLTNVAWSATKNVTPRAVSSGTPLAEDLVDDFNRATLDNGLWLIPQNARIAFNALRIDAAEPDTGTGEMESVNAYDLRGSAVAVHFVQPSDATYVESMLRIEFGDGSDNFIDFQVHGSPQRLLARIRPTGSFFPYAGDVEVAYNPTAHAWLRIRLTGGVLYWETSPDFDVDAGGSPTWTTIKSANLPYGNEDAVKVHLACRKWSALASGTNLFAIFDSVNGDVEQNVEDVTPPTVTITSPSNGATINGSQFIGVSAADPETGMSLVRIGVDNTELVIDSSAPFGYTLDTTTLTDGVHTIYAQAQNAVGLTAETEIQVTVDNASVQPGEGSLANRAFFGAGLNELPGTAELYALETQVGAFMDAVLLKYSMGDTLPSLSALQALINAPEAVRKLVVRVEVATLTGLEGVTDGLADAWFTELVTLLDGLGVEYVIDLFPNIAGSR